MRYVGGEKSGKNQRRWLVANVLHRQTGEITSDAAYIEWRALAQASRRQSCQLFRRVKKLKNERCRLPFYTLRGVCLDKPNFGAIAPSHACSHRSNRGSYKFFAIGYTIYLCLLLSLQAMLLVSIFSTSFSILSLLLLPVPCTYAGIFTTSA